MHEQHYQQTRRTRGYPDESRRQQGSWEGGRQSQYRPGEYGQYGEQGSHEEFEPPSRYGRYGGQSDQYGGQSGEQSGQYGGQFGGQYDQSRSRPEMGRGYGSEYSQQSRPGQNRGESSQYGGTSGQHGQPQRGSYRGDEFRPDTQSYGESEMHGSMSSQPWFNQSSYGGYAGYGSPSYGDYGGYGRYGGAGGAYSGYGGGGMGGEQREGRWSGQQQSYGSGGSGQREGREAGGQYGGFGQGGGLTRSLGTRSYGKPPKNFQRSGDRIREEIAEQLMREPSIDASDVEIQVQGSEVTLEGTVPERWMKRQIEDIAEYAMGVEEVENHIRVKRQSDSQSQKAGNRDEGSESSSSGRSTGRSSTASNRGATSMSGSGGRNT